MIISWIFSFIFAINLQQHTTIELSFQSGLNASEKKKKKPLKKGHYHEGKTLKNPKNTFLSKSDTAYDFVKLGTNLANLKDVPAGSNVDEPDIMVVPFGGKKEKDYLKKQLKRIGYKTQDADKPGDDAHVDENFADGKVKGKSKPGRVKKSGASCNGTVTQLRKRAKNASGEKAKMYHWCANMKSGKK